MRKLKWIIFSGMVFLITLNISAENDKTDPIQDLIIKHCPESTRESKYKAVNSIIQKLPLSAATTARNIMEYILPQACLSDYPIWLLDRTINLAVYAYHNGLTKSDTLTYMNELIPSVSLGKTDYISYANLFANLLNSGLEKEYIFEILDTALDQSYGVAGSEALAYYYVISAAEGKNHQLALTFALSETKLYKGQSDRFYVLNQLFGTEDEKKLKLKSADQEKLKITHEETLAQFWTKHKNKVKIKRTFAKLEPKLNHDSMKEFLTKTIGTQYEYRSNKEYGTDIHGIISRLTKIPVNELPLVYTDYCSQEPVIIPAKLRSGDLILLSPKIDKKEMTALGIYIDNSEFIYMTISNGVTLASLNDSYFKARFIKGCRIFQ